MKRKDIIIKDNTKNEFLYYKALFENSNECMFVLDKDGNILVANDKSVKLYGF